jgi:hypothetical protein
MDSDLRRNDMADVTAQPGFAKVWLPQEQEQERFSPPAQ